MATKTKATAVKKRAGGLIDVPAAYAARAQEAMKIIKPTPAQMAFIICTALIKLAWGGNRAGKTFINMVDCALIVTGEHPARKYPRGYKGRLYLVAVKQESLSRIYYSKLFDKGAFKTIKDKTTKLIRAWDPTNADDLRREREDPRSILQGPPLIPKRMIKSESYYSVKDRYPHRFVIKNDYEQEWEMLFFTNDQEPLRGEDIDGAYITEELTDGRWIDELLMRRVDRKGFISMDAAIQDGMPHYLNILDRAEDQKLRGVKNPTHCTFQFAQTENTFLDQEEVQRSASALSDSEEVAIRVYGQANRTGFLMFPSFGIRNILPQSYFRDGLIPKHWTRYMAIDLGWGRSAVLFCAVPRPGEAPFKGLVYDELVMPQHLHSEIACAVRDHITRHPIQAFILDMQGGRKTAQQTGMSDAASLKKAFREHNVRSVDTGYGFRPGYMDWEDGASKMRHALAVQPEGFAEWMILEGACKSTQLELKKLRKERHKDATTGKMIYEDVPDYRQEHDCYDAFRYLVCGNLQWIEPLKGGYSMNPRQMARAERRRKRAADAAGLRGGAGSVVHLGKSRHKTAVA